MAQRTFLLGAATIVGVWAWLGASVPMPPAPLSADGKFDCLSYTPFQATGSPFDAKAPIDKPAIAADIERLAPVTKCLRTYSAIGHGIDAVAANAARLGLTVLQGAWISRDATQNEAELRAAAKIANDNPGTVTAIVAGNEVLLRQEQTPAALVALIERAKELSGLPVTYADVWEFWLRYPEVAKAVDFITIHILPFWEDEPVSAAGASRHVAGIYARMSAAFPGRRIIIGEVGWPSAGRMRDAALPSPVNQARVLHDVVAMTRARNITANVIEAFDQPWKRRLEGTVGGHWGLYDAVTRAPKFTWGKPVSNHPAWIAQAFCGVTLAGLVIWLSAGAARRRPIGRGPLSTSGWMQAGFIATAGAIFAGLAFETLLAGAHGATGVARAIMLGVVAFGAPLVSVGLAGGVTLPSFAQVVGPERLSIRCPLTRFLGLLYVLTFLATAQSGLSLVFDPRYWELPYASLSGAVLAFALLRLQPGAGTRVFGTVIANYTAERLGAALLLLAAALIAVHEGFANWQAQWFAAALIVLALTMLLPPADAPAQIPEQ